MDDRRHELLLDREYVSHKAFLWDCTYEEAKARLDAEEREWIAGAPAREAALRALLGGA